MIARRLRESGVYCELHPFSITDEKVKEFDPKAIILSGSPAFISQENSPRAPQQVFEQGVPVLGICYGQHTMCAQFGGKVTDPIIGNTAAPSSTLRSLARCSKGMGQGAREQVWMSHGDRVTGAERLPRRSPERGAPFAVIADDARHFYGVQFHPEVVHTPHGAQLLRNFTHHVAGCSGEWTMAAFREEEIAQIRDKVGKGKVICGLSGGVDSSVAAVLLHEAIGDQLTCIFVETGLMRTGEADRS